MTNVLIRCRGKFLQGIYLYSICERESGTTQTPGNLHGKPTEGKNRGENKEISLNQRYYKEFSALNYRFNSLAFDPLQKRNRSAFIAEG